MALIHCPECGKEVSEHSRKCIHCGYPVKKTAKKNRTIAAVAVVVIAGLIFALILTAGKSISLPYGIQPDMALNEMIVRMEEAGIAYERATEYPDVTNLFFDGAYLYGLQNDFSVIRYEMKSGRLYVDFYFTEAGEYGRQNPSSRYDALQQKLMDEYGKPDHDMAGLCRWNSGKYSLCLSYTDNTGGNLSLSYAYEP